MSVTEENFKNPKNISPFTIMGSRGTAQAAWASSTAGATSPSWGCGGEAPTVLAHQFAY